MVPFSDCQVLLRRCRLAAALSLQERSYSADKNSPSLEDRWGKSGCRRPLKKPISDIMPPWPAASLSFFALDRRWFALKRSTGVGREHFDHPPSICLGFHPDTDSRPGRNCHVASGFRYRKDGGRHHRRRPLIQQIQTSCPA